MKYAMRRTEGIRWDRWHRMSDDAFIGDDGDERSRTPCRGRSSSNTLIIVQIVKRIQRRQ